MRVCLVTLGDAGRVTGGYLFHRRMAHAAPHHDASLTFVSFPDLPFPLPVAAGPLLLRRMHRRSPEVVVLDSIAAAFIAPWLGLVSVPLAAMLHQPSGGIDHARARKAVQTRLDVVAYRRSQRILVAAERLIPDLIARGIEGSRVSVVPPGRDPAPASTGPPIDLRKGRKAALLCVANWAERKGILDLVDAFAALPWDFATLHLVGDPSGEPAYAARVSRRLQEQALQDRVVAHGILTPGEVARMYASADVFVLPSLRETYGTVYGEAMAAGLPVVGWDAGNLPNLARDGVEGLIVSPGDIDGLTEALRTLCDDPSRCAALGRAAQQRARSFPTWEQTADRFFAELRAITTSVTRN